MATTKITITLEDEQIAAIRALVVAGQLKSVSGFVKHAVAVSLSDVAGWGAMLAMAMTATGGPLTKKERSWADSILKPQPKKRPKPSDGARPREPARTRKS